jgi:purine-cytosine permease-like protein
VQRKKKLHADNYWFNGFSIDETRVSVLIFVLVYFVIIAGFTYVTRGDFTANMLQVIMTLITAIAGVNIADSFANRNTQQYTYQQQDVSITKNTDDGEGPESNTPTI